MTSLSFRATHTQLCLKAIISNVKLTYRRWSEIGKRRSVVLPVVRERMMQRGARRCTCPLPQACGEQLIGKRGIKPECNRINGGITQCTYHTWFNAATLSICFSPSGFTLDLDFKYLKSNCEIGHQVETFRTLDSKNSTINCISQFFTQFSRKTRCILSALIGRKETSSESIRLDY